MFDCEQNKKAAFARRMQPFVEKYYKISWSILPNIQLLFGYAE